MSGGEDGPRAATKTTEHEITSQHDEPGGSSSSLLNLGSRVALLSRQLWSLVQTRLGGVTAETKTWRAVMMASVASLMAYRPARSSASETLTVVDNRTKRQYDIRIARNSINAAELQKIHGPPTTPTTTVNDHQTVAGGGVGGGLRIFDPGFANTACIESSITFVDGTRGHIQYRDYPLHYLFEKYDYEDVIHLLIWARLPSAAEKKAFQREIARGCVPPDHVSDIIAAFPRDALTSSMVIAGMAAYASLDETSMQNLEPVGDVAAPASSAASSAASSSASSSASFLGQPDKIDAAVIRCISALATVVALVYCHKRNKRFTPADPDASFIANVLHMMGLYNNSSNKDNEDDDEENDLAAQRQRERTQTCFEKLWILYADHEMTNSTAAFLHAASTLTDPLSCCIAGIVSGYGPLHGGAIELAYKTFARLQTPDKVPGLMAEVKAKRVRLFGYGHRVYKGVDRDPRIKFLDGLMERYMYADINEDDKTEPVMKKTEKTEKMEKTERTEKTEKKKMLAPAVDPLLAVAMEIDRVARSDEYFTSRHLKANADLYGSFLYTALGFETDIIVAMATLSRIPGVMAHWRELMLDKSPKLWRPQQIFTGQVAAGLV